MSGNVIKKLRDLSGVEGTRGDDQYYEIYDTFDAYKPEGYSYSVVDSSFEEGGRWSNIVINVYEVVEDTETAYFEFWQEVPATEMQDGMDLSYGLREVTPKEVIITKFVAKEASKP